MLRIRRFEETVLEAFPRGLIFGTTHTSIGQEADAAGVLSQIEVGDIVVSNHRCHGHFLAYGGPMVGLAAELMGRETGVCGGRGGSQHLQWRDFYANGILGGTIPLAVGMALAEKQRQGRVVVAFTGDGALGEGVVYESLNMAALWRLPVLIVLENNRYAQSTPIARHLAGGISARFQAFGIPAIEIDTTDAVEIAAATRPLLDLTRAGRGPHALVIHTYRFAPHSKGDDTRDPDEIARYRRNDPLPLLCARLSPQVAGSLKDEVEAEVEAAFRLAEQAPIASPGVFPPTLAEAG
jgi:acetoin:2,6-dichlorophenolindophenol oxidoreductase subunit alpha